MENDSSKLGSEQTTPPPDTCNNQNNVAASTSALASLSAIKNTPPPVHSSSDFSLTSLSTQDLRPSSSSSVGSVSIDDVHTAKDISEKERSSSAVSFDSVTSFLKTSIFPSYPSIPPQMLRPAICKIPLKEIQKFCISLSGCGFLGSYHFGSVSCFVKNGKPVMSRLDRVSGASAGSLVASLLLLSPEKLDLGLQILYEMGDELNSLKFGALTPGYFLNQRLIRIVEAHLPDEVTQAQKKLVVSLTNHTTRKNELVSDFDSREHLIQCLLASCYIPMYSMGYAAMPPVISGTPYIDGGYTNNLPDFEDIRTITISPFSGSAEISPTDQPVLFDWQMTLGSQQMKVNLQNIVRGAQALFPPSRAVLEDYYNRGYKDTYRFLQTNDLLERPEGTPV